MYCAFYVDVFSTYGISYNKAEKKYFSESPICKLKTILYFFSSGQTYMYMYNVNKVSEGNKHFTAKISVFLYLCKNTIYDFTKVMV